MDKSAIEKIQESTTVPALIDQLESVSTLNPTMLVPDNMAVVSMEQHMEFASRYRLSYSTSSLKDFISYNADHDEHGATCFVSSDAMGADSIFDLGTLDRPGHKEHHARLRLATTAAYRALLDTNGHRLAQKQASEFIEDWSEIISVTTKTGDVMPALAAAQSLQNLTIESAKQITSKVHDFGESMSSMATVEAKHQDQLPAEFLFKCEPYPGLGEMDIAIRIGILTGGDKPQLVFRIKRFEALKEELEERLKKILMDSFSGLELKTYIGSTD